jgi:hypothetical protein
LFASVFVGFSAEKKQKLKQIIGFRKAGFWNTKKLAFEKIN